MFRRGLALTGGFGALVELISVGGSEIGDRRDVVPVQAVPTAQDKAGAGDP